MKKLNPTSTQIFLQLIAGLNGKTHVKIKSEPYNPLVIEIVGSDSFSKWGNATLYSFCQYYKLNGDVMQDPEMCFIVSEDQGDIYPYLYQQANMGIYEESVLLQEGEKPLFSRDMQDMHVQFANQWIHNLKNQDFIKQIEHGKVSHTD